MKKYYFIYLMVFLFGNALTFTSCSSSDDNDNPENNGTLEEPAYKSVSARYQISSSDSKYSSIELTESGNYIILKNSMSSNHVPSVSSKYSLTVCPWATQGTRATTYANIITGKYTVSGNVFTLEDFGTITVNEGDGTTVSLEIAETGAEPYTLTAAKKAQNEGSEQTNKLCRTWNMASMGLKFSAQVSTPDGNTANYNFDKTVEGGNLPELMYQFYSDMMKWGMNISGESISEEQFNQYMERQKKIIMESYTTINSIIFSQAGTYMVIYGNETLAISSWAWKDNTNSTLQYSWNYQNMSAKDVSGEVGVQFNGANCIITEANDDLMDVDMEGTAIMTYTLKEAK